jgi:hypothetical protein
VVEQRRAKGMMEVARGKKNKNTNKKRKGLGESASLHRRCCPC